MRAPAAIVAVPLLCGAAAGLHVYQVESLTLSAAFAAAIAVVAAAGSIALGDTGQSTTSLTAGALFAGLSLGATGAIAAYHPPLLQWFAQRSEKGNPVVLDGMLVEDATPGALGVSLFLAIERVHPAAVNGDVIRTSGGVRLSVAGSLSAARLRGWMAGRRLRVTATLREPAAYLNPGVPDDRRALARRGIVLVGSVKSAALVESLAPGSAVDEFAAAARIGARDRLALFVGHWSQRSAGVAAAILLGDRTGLEQDDERRLQAAGTYHVIAISGGNIAIFTAVCFAVLRLLRVPERVAAMVTICVLLIYGHIVAPSPSVQRAILAAVVYLAGRAIDQRGAPHNVLAVAAVSAIGYAPVAIADPGFLLSFGATFAILTAVPRLLAWRQVPRAVRFAAGVLAATIAAEVMLLPIAATFFSRVTINGLLLNFAAIPLMTVVQCGSLLLLAAASADAEIARALGLIVHVAAAGLLDSARFTDVAPWFSRDVLAPAWWLVALYYAGTATWLWQNSAWRLGRVVWAGAAVCIAIGSPRTSRDAVLSPPPGWLRVAFIDVGQGDSTLVIAPDGRAVLVDAGGFPIPALQEADSGGPRFDIGERVVTPSVRAFGVRRLDALIVTHGDPDHIGGASAVVRALRPRAILEGVPVPPHLPLRSLMELGDATGAEWRIVQPGHVTRWRAVSLRVLHPPLPDWERQRVRNEDSIVLEVSYGDVSIVLPGDVGSGGEAAALLHARPSSLVVLKAAHHGSATSSSAAFLAALRPQAVVFSAGRANRFGHPAPAVVARVGRTGAEMFSTGADGCIVVDTDGRVVVIRTWTGREVHLVARTAQLP
jgi:competence protein ComEC